jgi:hypothetical protein
MSEAGFLDHLHIAVNKLMQIVAELPRPNDFLNFLT